mmetsp:Transcript_57455/g.150890  ORF Transcript_57455/g.150890 Transcript_57455/m.150890 type:complete len:408 (+) Transcript_57455:226-1449(+)
MPMRVIPNAGTYAMCLVPSLPRLQDAQMRAVSFSQLRLVQRLVNALCRLTLPHLGLMHEFVFLTFPSQLALCVVCRHLGRPSPRLASNFIIDDGFGHLCIQPATARRIPARRGRMVRPGHGGAGAGRIHRVAILDGPAGRGFGIVANLACAVHVRTARRHLLGSVVGIACAPNVAVRGGIGRAPREGIRRCVTLGALEAAVRRHGIVGVAVAIDVAVVRLDVGGHHRCGGVACVHTGRQGEGRLNLHRECLAGANSARRVRVVHAGVAIVHHIVPRDVAPVDVLRPRRASNVNVVRVGVVRHGEEVLHASSATIDRVLPGAVSCVVERHEHLIRAAAAQRRRGATRVAQRRGSSDLAKDGDLLVVVRHLHATKAVRANTTGIRPEDVALIAGRSIDPRHLSRRTTGR